MSITLPFKKAKSIAYSAFNQSLSKVSITTLRSYHTTLPIPLTSQATCLGERLWPNSIIELQHLLLAATLR